MSTVTHRVVVAFVSTAVFIAGGCHRAQSGVPQPRMVESPVRHFPGVDIVPTTGSGFLIRVQSGMIGNGEPLYVIDGAPMKIQPNRGIDWFSPEVIADVKVLKSPGELAEYGPNGVNGVIVITTKRSPVHNR